MKENIVYDKFIRLYLFLVDNLKLTPKNAVVVTEAFAPILKAEPSTASRTIAMVNSSRGGSSHIRGPFFKETLAVTTVINRYQRKRGIEPELAIISKKLGIKKMREVEKVLLEDE